MKPEAVIFADDRPMSLDDDLYQWAMDAETLIRHLCADHADAQAEIARLRAALEKAIAEMEDDLVYIEAGEPGTCDRSHIDAALAVLNK